MQKHKVLILFAHPALQKSRVNRYLIAEARKIPGVTVHDLYETYPDFDIEIEQEQELLLQHDFILMHHPFFWYSTPAILKEWMDLVLEHGWAYGSEGTALREKYLMNVISTGGRESAYQKSGHNKYTIGELLVPIQQTAALCGMTYLPPFVVHGTHGMTESRIQEHAQDYHRMLQAFTFGSLDLSAAKKLTRLNADLGSLILQEAD